MPKKTTDRRPPKYSRPLRTVRLAPIAVTESERDVIFNKAAMRGQSVAEFCRERILM